LEYLVPSREEKGRTSEKPKVGIGKPSLRVGAIFEISIWAEKEKKGGEVSLRRLL